MSIRRFRCLALCSIVASTFAALPTARAAGGPTIDDALNAISAYAPQAMAEQGAPGLSVAITDRTHTLRIITLGYANVDAKTPVTSDTRFPIGSITKGMTASALMEMRDSGRFDPAKPVRDYLPWFSIHSGGHTIYAHQLLSHTGGIPDDYTFAPGYLFSVASLREAHTIFTPGTRWSYSNDGLSTAGAILSALDGRTWEQSVQARVFDRLGMSNSSASFTPQTLATTARGYTFTDMSLLTPPNYTLTSPDPGDFVDPAGTVISTPADMAKYMRFLINGGTNDSGTHVISAQSYAMMTTPDNMDGKPAGPTGAPELAEAPLLYQHYGYGLGLHQEGGDTIVAHTGGIAGYSACMETNVTRGYGVIGMSNLVEAPLHPCAIVLYAMQVLHAQSLGQPLPPVPAALGNYLQRTRVDGGAAFAGTYTSGTDASSLTIAYSGSTLSMASPSGSKTLYPRGGATYWVDDPRFAIYGLTFVPGKNGAMQIVSGSQWFYNGKYAGAKAFRTPADAARISARYESDQLWGTASVTRIFALKGRMTADGAPMTPRADGSYTLGTSTIRFDTPAAGQMQRMWIDGIPYYRIELP